MKCLFEWRRILLKDIDIRMPLINELMKINAAHSHRIIEEMAVCDGDARVDIAVANGKLCGYEIKSNADTLERLPLQQSCYDKTFDTVSIVVGEKYEKIIKDYVPDYWGILVIKERNDDLKLVKRRRAKINKNVDGNALLELLWREEILLLLKTKKIRGLSGKNKRVLRQIAMQNFKLKEIKNYTRETLKSRENWRA